MGILSEIAPVAFLTLMQLLTYPISEFVFGFYTWILPTPIFPILGYIYVRMSRNLSLSGTLWDDEEHRMWFEVDGPPSPEQQPKDRGIKVPITYIIRSKLRRRRKE
jgi:hypothetical protein